MAPLLPPVYSQLLLAAFALLVLGIVDALVVRFLPGIEEATVEIGVGPILADYGRHPFYFRVRSIPLFFVRLLFPRHCQFGTRAMLAVLCGGFSLLLGIAYLGVAVYVARASAETTARPPDEIAACDAHLTRVAGPVEVMDVTSQSRAQTAGIVKGDILTDANAVPLNAYPDLVRAYRNAKGDLTLHVSGIRETTVHVPKPDVEQPLERLGLTYGRANRCRPSLREWSVFETFELMLLEGSRAWWDRAQPSAGDLRQTSKTPQIWTALVLMAVTTCLMAAMKLVLYGTMINGAPPWFFLATALLTMARPGAFWIGILSLVLLRLPAHPKLTALVLSFLFLLVHVAPVLDGMMVGAIASVSSAAGLELYWSL